MTLAQFRNRFPEFRTVGDTPAQAALDASALETSSTEFGTAYTEAHGLLAAHKLACSPFGSNARLEKSGNRTTYELEREGVERRMILGADVVATDAELAAL